MLVEKGTSGRVHDDPKSEKAPQAVILRDQPFEVMVTFERYLLRGLGEHTEQSPMIPAGCSSGCPGGRGTSMGWWWWPTQDTLVHFWVAKMGMSEGSVVVIGVAGMR